MAPEGVDVDEIGRAMAAHPHVTEVHDLHVWEIGTSFPALSAHVLVEPEADCHGIRRELEQLLDERFEVEHTTLQVDHARADRLLQIGGTAEPASARAGAGQSRVRLRSRAASSRRAASTLPARAPELSAATGALAPVLMTT